MSRLMVVISLVIAAGCRTQTEIANSVTDGLLRPDARIEVHFVSEQVRDEEVGETLNFNPFTLRPKVAGFAQWRDRQTLAFVPNRPLTPGGVYKVSLDLNQILQGSRSTPHPPFVFQVAVATRALVDFAAKFIPMGDEPSKAELKGTLRFNQPVDTATLRQAVTVRDEKQDYGLAWLDEGQGPAYQFIVTALKRSGDTQRFWIRVAPEALGLPKARELTVDLPRLDTFKVSSLAMEQQGSGHLLRIAMSDSLAPAQDVKGFITVHPHLDLKATYVGERITVSAPFELETAYRVTIHPGIKSQWGIVLAEAHEATIKTYDFPPRIRFSQGGVFLPSKSKGMLAFRSTNVSRVQLKVFQIFEDNLGQFLQSASLRPKTSGKNCYNVKPVGVEIHTQTVELAPGKNRDLQHEIDISSLIAQKKGLFLVELSFTKKDVPFRCHGEARAEDSSGWYWDGPHDDYKNPCQYGFWDSNNPIRRPVIVSDIGLTLKQTRDELWVAATDIGTAEPLVGVRVSSFTYQRRKIASGTTGANGIARLKRDVQQRAFYVEASRAGQRTAIKLKESALDLSHFDVGGHDDTRATRAFVYSERGVYRPGDPIHLTAIVRNADDTFPRNHPLELRFFNPRGKQSTSVMQKDAKDGVYVFALKTEMSAYTGSWNAQFFLGSERIATQEVKVETIVPARLKVKLKGVMDPLPPGAHEVKARLEAQYLFGATAKGLKAKVTAALSHRARLFPAFKAFVFDATATTFKTVTSTIHRGALGDDGIALVRWPLPDMRRAPSDFQLTLTAKVFEKGGRFSGGQVSTGIEPWERYVGLKLPETSGQPGEAYTFHILAVDRDGNPLAGRKLEVKIYVNHRRWWWQLHRDDMKFKSDEDALLILEKTVTSSKTPLPFTFHLPQQGGQLLIEVRDGKDGHLANTFVQFGTSHARTAAGKNATHLLIRTDEESYAPGDTAKIAFESPHGGKALFTIEKHGRLLSHRWVEISSAVTSLNVPITERMLPNVYAALSFFQPHAQTVNDRPIRMYGVVPIHVESKRTELALSVEVPDVLRPQEAFRVKIKSNDLHPAQVTVAVVDEGLLSLTNFETPSPKNYFYAKRPIGVRTFDVFDQIIGVIWGDIHRRFSIGGDAFSKAARKQVESLTARRFAPVALFSGPLTVPAKGELVVDFEMPNYNGAVRIMTIGAFKGAYASIELTRPVKAPFILLPTLPRAAGPGDLFNVPVTLFALEEKIGKTDIAIQVRGPLKVEGPTRHAVDLASIGEEDVDFRLKGANEVGIATVAIDAKARKYAAHYETEFAIRPSTPVDTERIETIIEPGTSWSQALEPLGLAGTHTAELILSSVPKLNFKHRLRQLIRYPYGCSEQITSAALPQLFVGELFPTMLRANQVQRNVNAAITKLTRLQQDDGSFAYWPGDGRGHNWVTSYIGHFLALAKEKGYFVPSQVSRRWMRYQNRVAASGDGDVIQAYTLFTLALAGKPALGPMNALREDRLPHMSNSARALLAGAFQAAALPDVASRILQGVNASAVQEEDFAQTFGSILRDEAIMLLVFSQQGQRERAWKLYEKIAQQLNRRTWYSTQSLAWSLYAASRFIQEFGFRTTPLQVSVENGGATQTIKSDNYIEFVPLKIGSKLKLTSSTEKPIFASVVQAYVPLTPPQEAIAEHMSLKVQYFDESGTEMDPTSLPQGSSFWAVFRVATHSPIDNVALTQILPAGWEIENTRMTEKNLPSWLEAWRLGRAAYTDIRDDRIMWFFNSRRPNSHTMKAMKKPGGTFAVKLNAVVVGEYTLPPSFAEAMYNADYRVRLKPGRVTVTRQ